MDVKTTVEQLVSKIKNDDGLMASFKSDPAAAVKRILGNEIAGKIDDSTLNEVVDCIKAKLNIDNIGDALGKLGGLFGKK